MKQNLIVIACAIMLVLSPLGLRAQSSTAPDTVIKSPLTKERVAELELNADFVNALSLIKEQREKVDLKNAVLYTHTSDPNGFSAVIPITGEGKFEPEFYELVYEQGPGKTVAVFFAVPNPTYAPPPGGTVPDDGGPHNPDPCPDKRCGSWTTTSIGNCIPYFYTPGMCLPPIPTPAYNIVTARLETQTRMCLCGTVRVVSIVETRTIFTNCNCQ